MKTPTPHDGIAPALRALLVTALLIASIGAPVRATEAPIALVPEMERPEGIEAQPPSIRATLVGNPVLEDGLERFRQRIRLDWPSIRDTDLVALSRFHVEATRGYRLPASPGALAGRVIGLDDDGAHAYLELRGPRLPASFDIVHRHLVFYARYSKTKGTLDRVTATIRLEVYE